MVATGFERELNEINPVENEANSKVVSALSLMRLSILLELVLLLTGLSAWSMGHNPGVGWALLLAGPLLWFVAHGSWMSHPRGKGCSTIVLTCGVGAGLCLLLAGLESLTLVLLALVLMLCALGFSLLFCQSLAFSMGRRDLERSFGFLMVVPVVGTIAGFCYPEFFLVMAFVYIFWLVFYSGALHGLSLALEKQGQGPEETGL